jgi:cell division topological specificity factor
MTSSSLEDLKDELIEVISRHIDIDSGAVKIEMTKDGRQQRLVADIPVLGPRRKIR